VAALLAAGAVLALSSSGSGKGKPLRTTHARLTLEAYGQPETGETELLISLHDKRLNTPDRTGGAKSVELQCSDAHSVKFRTRTRWPLLEEYGYPYPHIHQLAGLQLLKSIRECRLTGPGISFEGRVHGPPPPATP
jgi:hypothetical protein